MQLITKEIVMTKDIGIHGNLFGGILMSWVDEAAGSFATEYCRTPQMVTLKVGEMLFKKPLKPGNHVRIYGEVAHLGRTSLTVNIEARKLNLYNGEEVVVCTTRITYVRIDEDGSSIPIDDSVREKYHREYPDRKKEE
ncbi:MAG TPA: hotdog domain-containing protein [Brumimicrobium sp.]|nr:hotdog domain-containing protein [Brumimicrobium sp.]